MILSEHNASTVAEVQQYTIALCRRAITKQQETTLEESKLRWDSSSDELKHKDPYNHDNFHQVVSLLAHYITCIQTCGVRWLGLRYSFPLICLLVLKYQYSYQLNESFAHKWWADLVISWLQGNCKNFFYALQPHQSS